MKSLSEFCAEAFPYWKEERALNHLIVAGVIHYIQKRSLPSWRTSTVSLCAKMKGDLLVGRALTWTVDGVDIAHSLHPAPIIVSREQEPEVFSAITECLRRQAESEHATMTWKDGSALNRNREITFTKVDAPLDLRGYSNVFDLGSVSTPASKFPTGALASVQGLPAYDMAVYDYASQYGDIPSRRNYGEKLVNEIREGKFPGIFEKSGVELFASVGAPKNEWAYHPVDFLFLPAGVLPVDNLPERTPGGVEDVRAIFQNLTEAIQDFAIQCGVAMTVSQRETNPTRDRVHVSWILRFHEAP